MSNTVSFPNMPEVEEQAALWLAALDRGLSEKENQKLEQWIDEHPTHAETLVKFASMWDELDVLKPISCIMPLEVQHINTEAEQIEQEEQARANSGFVRWAMAACVMLGVALTTFHFLPTADTQKEAPLFYSSYETEIGENSDVTLPDGSVLKLNTNTSLTVVYSKDERRVLLHEGEAHFDVAENKDYPFRAIVGSSTVTAIGTAFNIQIDKQQKVEVTVTEGRVLVDKVQLEEGGDLLPVFFESETEQAQNDGVFLEVGEMAFIGIEGDDAQVLNEEDLFSSSLAWQQGMIIFQGESLTEVIEEVSRYTTIKFEIIDEKIADTSVGGYFKTGDVDQLLVALEQNFDIPYSRRGNRVKLGTEEK